MSVRFDDDTVTLHDIEFFETPSIFSQFLKIHVNVKDDKNKNNKISLTPPLPPQITHQNIKAKKKKTKKKKHL